MTVIWGLDLHEMQWAKFKNSYMWSKTYHLRRSKFIIYQAAMILCVVSESLGTDVLSDYIDERKSVKQYSASLGSNVTIRSHDIIGAFSYNIFVGVFVATIFGAAFFFDLFWPERRESKDVRIAWKVCSVLSCCFTLSSAIVLTVILATKRATLVGNDTGIVLKLDTPLEYKHNGEAIASVVLIWLGFVFTCAATGLMFSSITYIERYGTAKSSSLRREENKEARTLRSRRGSGAASRSGLTMEDSLPSSSANVANVNHEKEPEPV